MDNPFADNPFGFFFQECLLVEEAETLWCGKLCTNTYVGITETWVLDNLIVFKLSTSSSSDIVHGIYTIDGGR